MDPKLHAILGQLHNLLSIAQPDDLERASRLRNISPFMREALRALAKERNRESRKDGRADELSRRTETQGAATPKAGPGGRFPEAGRTEDQVQALILDSPRFSKKADVVNFAGAMGLTVGFTRKDSWRRAVRKLAIAIAMAPDDVRKKSMEAILASRDDQTEGWVNVIRKSR
jgi:hypothetical protein